jgi:3',5'-cyclic AMP phosphodiesterase CpdA
VRVLHFSDIHLDFQLRSVPLRDWLGKRAVGGGNYLLRRRRVFRDGQRKLDALARLLSSRRPDLVVFSGDFTTLGTELELRHARLAIEPIRAAAESFVCVPGNHDVYLDDVLRQGRFERNLGDLLGTDVPDLAVDGRWPIARLIGDSVAVVALDSSRPNPSPWRSSGRVPGLQMDALARLLGDERLANRFVFVVTHYSPCLPDGRPDTRQHGLDNAAELMAAMATLGDRGALLCGHVHHCFERRLLAGAPRVFCAGSATFEGREGLWQFDLDALDDVDDEDVDESGGRRQQVVAARGRWSQEGWSFAEEVRWSYATAG